MIWSGIHRAQLPPICVCSTVFGVQRMRLSSYASHDSQDQLMIQLKAVAYQITANFKKYITDIEGYVKAGQAHHVSSDLQHLLLCTEQSVCPGARSLGHNGSYALPTQSWKCSLSLRDLWEGLRNSKPKVVHRCRTVAEGVKQRTSSQGPLSLTSYTALLEVKRRDPFPFHL